ncbi:hypothetical protein Q1695_004452 [Nippostrongylus brasiliensis]|nr:hypothetical protein Q1695_004452 [Nippostrongylus brasiliensis]
MNWQNRERVIHEKLFDTLSRPLSRSTGSTDDEMFSGRKVKWNHFGKKYTLRISDYEMEYADLYDAFMKKVHEVRPDFEGAIAYIDQYGRQVIVNSDKEFRDAISHSKGKLKLHTTLTDGQMLSAAEIAGRPNRSHSVPPTMDRGYQTYPPTNSRSPSSMDSAPPTYRNRTISPPPAPVSNHSKQPLHSPGSYSGLQIPPPGYGYKYTSGPYSQNLLYGMPPHSGMLLRFLASPFPFGGHHRSFIGPNKYHQFGGWTSNRYYTSVEIMRQGAIDDCGLIAQIEMDLSRLGQLDIQRSSEQHLRDMEFDHRDELEMEVIEVAHFAKWTPSRAMILLQLLLAGEIILSPTFAEKSLTKVYDDGVIPLVPQTLSSARFLKLQRFPLLRLAPPRQARRRSTGAPTLICGEGVMGVVLKRPFRGRIFASHREKDPQCLEYYSLATVPRFVTALYGGCGVWRRKSILSSTTDFHLRLVVSYDFVALTEEDRIYDLTCSYTSKNVSVEAHYDTVNFVADVMRNSSEIPQCQYSIRVDALDGPRIQSAILGQLVFHRWSCPSDEYSFKVYRCYVHNGAKQSYQIINDDGCSLDEAILPHPTYDFRQGIVYAATKAFRLTASKRVFFNCMLSICHRTDEQCMQEIPPRCPRTLRKRRHIATDELSMEQRLQRLQTRLSTGNLTFGYSIPDEFTHGSDGVLSTFDLPQDDRASSKICRPSSDRSAQWIYALLMTNVLSVLVAVLACSVVVARTRR